MKQYFLVNIVTNQSVAPPWDAEEPVTALFSNSIALALANDVLRKAGFDWRWELCRDKPTDLAPLNDPFAYRLPCWHKRQKWS